MNERLPTEALNRFLRRLLGRRIYARFVEPGVIDTQEDYWPERAAGNRWMARWGFGSCIRLDLEGIRAGVTERGAFSKGAGLNWEK